jgi:hypothetical protein
MNLASGKIGSVPLMFGTGFCRFDCPRFVIWLGIAEIRVEARIDGTWNFTPNYLIWFLIFSRVGGGEINPCEIKFGFYISISIRFCAD